MDRNRLHFTLRVDKTLFNKFRYIAKMQYRSANKEIEQYLKRAVAKYEEENGKITFSENEDSED